MNKFKRILLASGLAATASLMANSPAFAQSTNATVNLSGSIPYALQMTVNPITAAAGSLDLSPTVGGRTVKIATITGATTNSENGLKVGTTKIPMTSSTGGTIDFDVRDAAGANADTTATMYPADNVTGELNYTKSYARGSASDSSIFIFYNVGGEVPPGTYTGSVTFTVINR